MGNKKANDFIAQGSILAMASILVRIIGMIYRIPMTAIIGDEGNGLYSYAYSIYTILLLLSSYSLPLAVSKMISVRVEVKQWKNVERIFICALLFGMMTGTVFAALVLFGAKAFTTLLYKEELAAIALRMMAPTILIMAVLGVFRGFFQGLQTTKPTAVSQLLEQVVNAIVSIIAAFFLFGYGETMNEKLGAEGLDAAWGAAGGALGTGAGALIALVFFAVLYLRFRKGFLRQVAADQGDTVQSYSDIFKTLVMIAVPVILSTAVYNLIDLIDGSLFSYYMTTTGGDNYQAVWGAYTGKALLMIHIPVSISSAMAVSLVPSLTAAYSAGRKRLVYQKIHAILKFTGTVAFPSAAGLLVLADPIIKTLFPGDTSKASFYLAVGAAAVVFFSFSTITNSILQGIDRMGVPVRHSVISIVIHIAVSAVLMWGFKLGMIGIIIGYILFGISMTVLNFIALHKTIGYDPDWGRIAIMPLVCSAIMGLICFGIYQLLHLFAGKAIPMIISVIVSILVYFVLVIKTGLMTERDLNDLPMGRRLAVLARKMNLLK